MKDKSFIYYGYERATYEDCKSLISVMNRRHFGILSIWFIVVAAVYLFFSWNNMNGFNSTYTPTLFAFFAMSMAMEIFIRVFPKLADRWGKVLMHVIMLLLMGFGTVCSYIQPYMAATIFLVILVIIALSFITNMVDMLAMLAIGCTCFLLVSNNIKPISIFKQDLFNVMVVVALSIVLHYTFQRAHIRQFITFRQSTRMQQELEIKSSFDALTSLLNRGRFFSMAGEVLRQENEDCIVLGLIDLDKFKQINDTMGHQMGDKVIQLAGKTILDTLGIEYDEKWSFPERAIKDGLSFAGRLGGDEFVVLIRNLKDEDEMREAFDKLLATLNDVKLEGMEGIHASIGVTTIGNDDRDIDEAYTRADEALYRSKEAGRNRVSLDRGDTEGGETT